MGEEKPVQDKSTQEKSEDANSGRVIEDNTKLWSKPTHLRGDLNLTSTMTITIEANINGRVVKVSDEHRFRSSELIIDANRDLGEFDLVFDDLIVRLLSTVFYIYIYMKCCASCYSLDLDAPLQLAHQRRNPRPGISYYSSGGLFFFLTRGRYRWPATPPILYH